VISAGTSVRESVEIIRGLGATPAGVVIALDRQERGQTALSAVQEVQAAYGMPVAAIIRLDDLVAFLADRDGSGDHLQAIQAYRERYGVRP
jgi:orotate phosphoribosyltransferase